MFKFPEKINKTLLLASLIGLVVGLVPSLYFGSEFRKIRQEKNSLKKERQELLSKKEHKKIETEEIKIIFKDEDEGFYCENKKPTLAEIMNALPEEAKYYDIRFKGMSPECSYYALDIYYGGWPEEDWPEIDENCMTNKIVGPWVVETRTGKAKKIARCRANEGKYHEGNFSKWIADQLIELRTDGNEFARTVIVSSGKTIFRRINKINFYLSDITEDDLKPELKFVPLDKSFPECEKDGEVAHPLVRYDFDCLKKTDVELWDKGEVKLLIKYVDDETVEVNGVTYGNLLNYQSYVIHTAR